MSIGLDWDIVSAYATRARDGEVFEGLRYTKAEAIVVYAHDHLNDMLGLREDGETDTGEPTYRVESLRNNPPIEDNEIPTFVVVHVTDLAVGDILWMGGSSKSKEWGGGYMSPVSDITWRTDEQLTITLTNGHSFYAFEDGTVYRRVIA